MKQLLKDRKLVVIITAVFASIGLGSAIRLLTDAPNMAIDAPETLFKSAVKDDLTPLSTSLAAAANNLPTGAAALLQSTPAESRLPAISTGRADPFSSITQLPPVASNPTTPVAVGAVSEQSGGGLPLTPVAATQTLPPLPSLPPVSLEPAPIAQPAAISASSPANAFPPANAFLNPIDAIQVSGALHIGDRISIIVRESHQAPSRYVGVGAYLANGRIRVKRIDMISGEEPIVVLEQDGQEYFKRVGDTTLASL